MPGASNSLLLVTHVVLRNGPNGLQIDDQTAAGIAQWCRYFDQVTYFGIAEAAGDAHTSSTEWVDIQNYAGAERCQLVALPHSYRVGKMAGEYRRVRRLLAIAVDQHTHLCFTIGGLIGDWPAIGALEANRRRRKYSAWIDRVEPLIIRNRLSGASVLKRAAAMVALPTMERYTKFLLARSEIALLQGRDTFDHYSQWAPEPYCTYDTHTSANDEISSSDLAHKQTRIEAGEPLQILYVGRAAAMKGPFDWLEVLNLLHRRGVAFRATWLGDGPDLRHMQERTAELELSAVVKLPGFQGDREEVLRAMRNSDLLLFCHKTPESARCLIEALVSGCALVGYETAYPRGLVEAQGGGVFSPQDDVLSLVGRISDLATDRPKLANVVGSAAASGKSYNEDVVYAYRAKLMLRA